MTKIKDTLGIEPTIDFTNELKYNSTLLFFRFK